MAQALRGWLAAALRGLLLVAFGAALVTGLGVADALTADPQDVKYYEVKATHDGSPETLSLIAGRFLGSPTRALEIFYLNVGRTQADGSALAEGEPLRAGWKLVLPWDASGDGVQYGPPPWPHAGSASQPLGGGPTDVDGSGRGDLVRAGVVFLLLLLFLLLLIGLVIRRRSRRPLLQRTVGAVARAPIQARATRALPASVIAQAPIPVAPTWSEPLSRASPVGSGHESGSGRDGYVSEAARAAQVPSAVSHVPPYASAPGLAAPGTQRDRADPWPEGPATSSWRGASATWPEEPVSWLEKPSPWLNAPEPWLDTPPWLDEVEPWHDVRRPWPHALASPVDEPSSSQRATAAPAVARIPSDAPLRPWVDLRSPFLETPEPSDLPLADDVIGPVVELSPTEATLAEPDHESAGSWMLVELDTAGTPVRPDGPITHNDRQRLRALLEARYDRYAQVVHNQMAQRPGLRPIQGEHMDAAVTELVAVVAFGAGDEVFDSTEPDAVAARTVCLTGGARRLPTHLGAVFGSWTFDPRLLWRAGMTVVAEDVLLGVAPPGRPPLSRPVMAAWSAAGRRADGLIDEADRVLFMPGSRWRVVGVEGPDPRSPSVLFLRQMVAAEWAQSGESMSAVEQDRRALESLRRAIDIEPV